MFVRAYWYLVEGYERVGAHRDPLAIDELVNREECSFQAEVLRPGTFISFTQADPRRTYPWISTHELCANAATRGIRRLSIDVTE